MGHGDRWFGVFGRMVAVRDGSHVGQPDRQSDAKPADTFPDTLPDTLPDAVPDAIPDAISDAVPDAISDAVPDI